MADYAGWKVYQEVVIIESALDDSKEGISSAYIADAKDSGQLKTGRDWAALKFYSKFTGKTDKIPGKEYRLPNNGFTLEIGDAPTKRAEGGRASFSMCIIRNNNKAWKVGIATDLLYRLLKETACVNGVIKEKLSFGRCYGKLGLLVTDGDTMKSALKEDALRNGAKKTTKAKIGYEHKSLRINKVYMFDLYDWTSTKRVALKDTIDNRLPSCDTVVKLIEFKDKPVKKHVYQDVATLRKIAPNSLTVGDVIEHSSKVIDESLNNTYSPLYSLPETVLGGTEGDELVEKFPARVIGDKLLEPNITKEQYDSYISRLYKLMSRVNNHVVRNNVSEYNLRVAFGMTFKPEWDKEFTKEQLQSCLENSVQYIAVKYQGELIIGSWLRKNLRDSHIKELMEA